MRKQTSVLTQVTPAKHDEQTPERVGPTPPTVGERLLYDLNSVAFLTSLSRAEIEREIARGKLASIKRGRRRLVPRSALIAYCERLSA